MRTFNGASVAVNGIRTWTRSYVVLADDGTVEVEATNLDTGAYGVVATFTGGELGWLKPNGEAEISAFNGSTPITIDILKGTCACG